MAWALAAPASLVGDLYDDSVFVIEVIPDCGPTWKNGICSAWVHVGRLFGSHAHRDWMRSNPSCPAPVTILDRGTGAYCGSLKDMFDARRIPSDQLCGGGVPSMLHILTTSSASLLPGKRGLRV